MLAEIGHTIQVLSFMFLGFLFMPGVWFFDYFFGVDIIEWTFWAVDYIFSSVAALVVWGL